MLHPMLTSSDYHDDDYDGGDDDTDNDGDNDETDENHNYFDETVFL